jgi:hypothetical protein
MTHRMLTYDVTILDSGDHGLEGLRADLEIHYGPVAVFAHLAPRGPVRALTWKVGHTARGEDILVVSGPSTAWRFQVNAG